MVAKPLHSPEKISLAITTPRTVPYCENNFETLSSVADLGSPRMKRVSKIRGILRFDCNEAAAGGGLLGNETAAAAFGRGSSLEIA